MNEPSDGPGRRGPVSDEQWVFARQLVEGMPATSARVAAALDTDLGWFHKRAKREGWRKVDYRHQDVLALHREAVALSAIHTAGGDFSVDDPQAGEVVEEREEGAGQALGEQAGRQAGGADPAVTVERARSFLSRQMDRLMKRAERGGRIDKAQVEGVLAMSKMMERWMEAVQASVVDQKKKSDDELAEILRSVNAKIVELAQAEARRLVQAGSDRNRCRARRRGMDA